jgi:hypothetical protein
MSDISDLRSLDRRHATPSRARFLRRARTDGPKELATVSSMTIDTHTGTVYVTESNGRIVASHY